MKSNQESISGLRAVQLGNVGASRTLSCLLRQAAKKNPVDSSVACLCLLVLACATSMISRLDSDAEVRQDTLLRY